MLGRLFVLFYLLLLATLVAAVPLNTRTDALTPDSPRALSSSEIEGYQPYTYLAGASYCPLSSWNCGCEPI